MSTVALSARIIVAAVLAAMLVLGIKWVREDQRRTCPNCGLCNWLEKDEGETCLECGEVCTDRRTHG